MWRVGACCGVQEVYSPRLYFYGIMPGGRRVR